MFVIGVPVVFDDVSVIMVLLAVFIVFKLSAEFDLVWF